ncbi:MAG: TIGR02206 family membrane protein [Verrucomicrobiota bacterium]|nr:TIGR02206 family membrane protein [Verrucomicrobiota bacterium]
MGRAVADPRLNETSTFQLFGTAHIVAILLTLTVPFIFAALSRRAKISALDRFVRYGLAALMTINFIGYAVRASVSDGMSWRQTLPFQLCDWTMVVVIIALVNGGRPRWLEVAYFWGIGGSLQAVLTPDLRFGFPDYRFLSFFIGHCGIPIGIIYLMLSRGFRPHLISVWRTLLWSEFYLVVTLIVDWITVVNYGFLLHKPVAFSILSYLSDDRPLYLMEMNGLALIFFAILYAPFAMADVLAARARENA